MKELKKHFFTGLIILLPLAITLMTLSFIINFLTEPFVGILSKILENFTLLHGNFFFWTHQEVQLYCSKFLVLVFLFLLTVLLGLVTRFFVTRALLSLGDQLLLRIPLVNTIYKTTQDILKTLFVSDKNAFKQVVLVPFPRKDIYALGLISRPAPSLCSDAAQEELISVLIPTTPNPTTGFLLLYKRKDLTLLDMKSEEAIKFVVSCGVLAPPHKEEIAP